MPEGFLFSPAGILTVQSYGINLSSVFSYSDLPTDGTEALNANGAIVPAIAENFAGQTYTVPEPSVVTLFLVSLTLICIRFRSRSDGALNTLP